MTAKHPRYHCHRVHLSTLTLAFSHLLYNIIVLLYELHILCIIKSGVYCMFRTSKRYASTVPTQKHIIYPILSLCYDGSGALHLKLNSSKLHSSDTTKRKKVSLKNQQFLL